MRSCHFIWGLPTRAPDRPDRDVEGLEPSTPTTSSARNDPVQSQGHCWDGKEGNGVILGALGRRADPGRRVT